MEFTHPYSRYGLALVLHQYSIEKLDDIEKTYLINELIRGLNHFRTRPIESFVGKEEVKFGYLTREFLLKNSKFQSKGDPDNGIFLCPNIITTDKNVKKVWGGIESLIKKLKSEKNSKVDLTMSLFATSAKFNNGKKSQRPPTVSQLEAACAGITNITPFKPCMAYRIQEKVGTKRINTAIIPDLPLNEMIKFIALFQKMLSSETSEKLQIGKIRIKKTKTRDKEAEKRHTEASGEEIKIFKNKYTPWRPQIFNGNFPNPPLSSALGSLTLLGSIGEWAKKSNNWEEGKQVLDSLKDVAIYMFSYGNGKSFRYNHFIIDLAKDAKLNSIIDAIYYTKLFNAELRSQNKHEYQKFDLFSSRFLQLFNHSAFKDFLAFRAEYPYQLEILFTTYFTKMEKIPIDIVQSSRELGRWLNYVAYLTAKAEHKNNTKSEEFKKTKAKILIEMESSVFSSKSGDALVAQVITRAGRLSSQDAPSEAGLFIEKASSGELPLENAKNLLMAFSRLRSKPEILSDTIKKNHESIEEDTSDFIDS